MSEPTFLRAGDFDGEAWPPDTQVILIEPLEPDGAMHVGARVRVTPAWASPWEGTVTDYEGAPLAIEHDHEWVDASDLSDADERQLCRTCGEQRMVPRAEWRP